MTIEEFCREHGIEIREHGQHHHTTSGWLSIDCPNCSPNSGRFRLGWNLRGKYFSCWSCGKLPTFPTWIEVSGLTSREIKIFLGELNQDEEYQEQKLPGRLQLPLGLGNLLPAHIKYLHDVRGFSHPQIVELENLWKIQGIDWRAAQLAWRIFIPVHADGQTVSWTTRAIGINNSGRYVTARKDQEKVNLKQVLYGNDYVYHAAIVVEGPFDVWKIGPGAVAIMGLEYTRSQLMALSRFQVRYICLDNDEESQRVAERLCNELMMFGPTHNIVLDSKDPGEATEEEIRKLRSLL